MKISCTKAEKSYLIALLANNAYDCPFEVSIPSSEESYCVQYGIEHFCDSNLYTCETCLQEHIEWEIVNE